MAVTNSIESSIAGGRFSRFEKEESRSTVKRGFSKITHGVGGVFTIAGTITSKTEGVHRIAKVAVSSLAFAVLFAGKATGVTEIEGVFSGVKNFLDAIEIVGNVKEWGEYVQSLGKSHTWKQIVGGFPKLTSTFFFTIGNGMQFVAFVAPLAKGVYDVTKYLAFSIGNIPIFGTVMNGVFGVALAWGIVAKGVDFIKACRGLSKASNKKARWINERSWGEVATKPEKDKKVEDLAKHYTSKAEGAETRLKALREAKKAAETTPETAKFDRSARKELKKLEAQLPLISVWKNRAAELKSDNKDIAFQEITKHKIERMSTKQANNSKMIVKSIAGSMINAAKIALIVASVVFLALGFAGLPFTLGLLTAALLINIAGLGNFAWWELWGAKPLPVRNALISVPEAAPAA